MERFKKRNKKKKEVGLIDLVRKLRLGEKTGLM